MKQSNVENFRTRTSGKYEGMLEGHAQWLENLERHFFPNTFTSQNNRLENGCDALKARAEEREIGNERS